MPRHVITFRASDDERQVLDAIRERSGVTTRSEALRLLVTAGARAYGLNKPRRSLRRLELPDPKQAA